MVACGDPKAENYRGDPVAIYRNGIKEAQTPDHLFSYGYYQACFQLEPFIWYESYRNASMVYSMVLKRFRVQTLDYNL